MAASKCTKLRNGHVAVESDHPRARHMYEIAEKLGCTIADLVGPERAEFYPANKLEADLIQFMRGLDEPHIEARVKQLGSRRSEGNAVYNYLRELVSADM